MKSSVICAGFAFRLHLAAFVVVAGIAAEWEEGVRPEGEKPGDGEASSDILDVGIESAVFVDDHDAGLFRGGPGGFGEIAAHFPGALGRGILGVFGLDAFVVLGHLLGEGVVRSERFEQRGDGDPADGEARGAFEESASVHPAVGVVVVEIEEFLIEV